MQRDFELAAGQGFDGARKHFGAAENGVEGLGKARGQAPAHRCLGMHRGRDACGQNTGNTCLLDQ
ncbi:hypothetical protein D3C85_1560610 [compost metagenome]